MQIAVCTIAYNEEQFIGAVINNWKGKVDKHIVLHTDKAWHGEQLPPDRTQEICEKNNVEFVRQDWKSEKEQRNFGLKYLIDYDYVIMVDADELFTSKDIDTILNEIGKERRLQDNTFCYRCSKIETYFKTIDYVFDPPDSHQPPLVFNPKKCEFKDCRIPVNDYQIPIDVTMHHISYLRNEKRIKSKLTQFEHHNQVKKDWWKNVWEKWTPEMKDVWAYGKQKAGVKKQPLPDELQKLLNNVII